MKLSPTQEDIINTKGNLIVRASAGTGKTFTMVHKIANDLACNRTHKGIAAITFTIKAAQEIKDRLLTDTEYSFVGTNNSFAIEEIIKPFMKDVYGAAFDLDMSTDYSVKVGRFQEGIEKIRTENILCSYSDSKSNFIFDLAYRIVEKSLACRLYLQAKYFKIYIDEYQDCDKDMHKLFMYICDELHIETFVVGDEKQSIYLWRGAYPEAFKSIGNKPNFSTKLMVNNFRSCQQIQNYSNLLCADTRKFYVPTESKSEIVLLTIDKLPNWGHEVLKLLDDNKTIALLRFRNSDAQQGAEDLTLAGVEFKFIPHTPIADITTETAWLYLAIAKYIIMDKYSVYDFISEIPAEGDENKNTVDTLKKHLENIENAKLAEKDFIDSVKRLAGYLVYQTREEHLKKLYETITDYDYYAAFETEKYPHIAITLHSSKGLEFDQVIMFAEDFPLSGASVYNHYVAATRAKTKLIIINSGNYRAKMFQKNLEKTLTIKGLKTSDVLLEMKV